MLFDLLPNGYGQEENNDPQTPGTHFHFQENTVPGGRPRFAPEFNHMHHRGEIWNL